MQTLSKKDLIILVADKNTEFTLKGLLSRSQALKIRALEFDIFVHPEHDPGCLLKSDDFLRAFIASYRYGMVLFDREGCGREGLIREELEEYIETRLSNSGWNTRAAAIVLDPELETWVWSDSPHVDVVLGWERKVPNLRTWLKQQQFLTSEQVKPERPKETMERALLIARKPRSSALYFHLAQRVSFERCSDPAFLKLKSVLQNWFALPD
jgi:hypothetical protein